jgi:hypothetical protein
MPRRRKKRETEPEESENAVTRIIQAMTGGAPRDADLVAGVLTDLIARGYDKDEEDEDR